MVGLTGCLGRIPGLGLFKKGAQWAGSLASQSGSAFCAGARSLGNYSSQKIQDGYNALPSSGRVSTGVGQVVGSVVGRATGIALGAIATVPGALIGMGREVTNKVGTLDRLKGQENGATVAYAVIAGLGAATTVGLSYLTEQEFNGASSAGVTALASGAYYLLLGRNYMVPIFAVGGGIVKVIKGLTTSAILGAMKGVKEGAEKGYESGFILGDGLANPYPWIAKAATKLGLDSLKARVQNLACCNCCNQVANLTASVARVAFPAGLAVYAADEYLDIGLKETLAISAVSLALEQLTGRVGAFIGPKVSKVATKTTQFAASILAAYLYHQGEVDVGLENKIPTAQGWSGYFLQKGVQATVATTQSAYNYQPLWDASFSALNLAWSASKLALTTAYSFSSEAPPYLTGAIALVAAGAIYASCTKTSAESKADKAQKTADDARRIAQQNTQKLAAQNAAAVQPPVVQQPAVPVVQQPAVAVVQQAAVGQVVLP